MASGKQSFREHCATNILLETTPRNISASKISRYTVYLRMHQVRSSLTVDGLKTNMSWGRGEATIFSKVHFHPPCQYSLPAGYDIPICALTYTPTNADTFAQDFFLTYPAFISMTGLCDLLRSKYQGPKIKVQGVDETSLRAEEDSVTKKRR